jgi:capsular polysaccharide biosynthesis protein
LAALGFESVLTERLSVHEQVEMFSQASVLVAPHGAGLANMVFARPGLTVLEIQPEGQDFSGAALYRFLAAACGHSYGCCVTPQDKALTLFPDPTRVVSAVERLIGSGATPQ